MPTPATNPTFGTLFVPATIERAMLDLLKTWLPIYLAEVERQIGIEPCTIARPRFYATSVEADHMPGEQLPGIIAVSPGTSENPTREDGAWAAWFDCTIVALVMTPEELTTRELAGYFAAAIRGAVLQHAGLGVDQVETTWWAGEEYQGEPGDQRNRTRGAALVHFRVKVRDVISTETGPLDPEAVADACDPYPPITTVQEVDIDVRSDDL
jgi:hypothetical protein